MTVIYMPKQSNGTVHSSKDLNQLIDYVMNPEKTNDFEYVSGQNILDIHSTCDEMLATRTMAIALKNKPRKNEVCSDPQNIDFSNLYFGGLFLWSNIP
ncbi:hypothetical protein [Lactococcus lactis]|uniref:hypothetical protein n=1 Tax=Lactococcus lactis TaxID=1358 RepID=UPI0003BE59B9|nr:hypothetical protein [Lactococcus lactis]ESK78000.1 relaxase [Lactococcus lactis subsp. lactis bv. diacetylactis str. LD61]